MLAVALDSPGSSNILRACAPAEVEGRPLGEGGGAREDCGLLELARAGDRCGEVRVEAPASDNLEP